MAVELKARLACEQRFQKRFALDELKAGDVASVEMQKIESIIDELHIAFAVGRGLGVGESRQSSLIDAAEFPIDVSGLNVQVRERCDSDRIFVGPVEAGPKSAVARARCRCAPPCDSRLI